MISKTIFIALAIAAAASTAHAQFTGSAVGAWGTPAGTNPGDVYSINNADAGGVASFSFGVGSPPNLFTFNGVGSDGGPGFSTAAETPFDIGHFTYFNGSTTNFAQMTTEALGIALNLTAPLHKSNSFL